MLKVLFGIAITILLFIWIFASRPAPKDPCPRCQSKNRARKFFFGEDKMEANQEIGNQPIGDFGEREICANCGYVFGAADKRGSVDNG